jgi:flagellar basal body rod protein FlgG
MKWVKMITGQRAYEINSKSIQRRTAAGHRQQPQEVTG